VRVRVLVGLVAVAAIVLTLFAFSGVAAANNAAVVINDQGCQLLDGNGGVVDADSDHSVITSSGNGLLSCNVQGVPNDTGKAVHYDFDSTGMTCDTLAGVATAWREIVSASGSATLTCQVK
jgi:hypothetical protein